jgi:hypothetical protein
VLQSGLCEVERRRRKAGESFSTLVMSKVEGEIRLLTLMM